MHVNKVVETPQGTIKFEGELSEAEADLVIKVGLNVLLQAGVLPVMGKEPSEEAAIIIDTGDTLQ
jgi:hypothetical protein